MLHHMKLGDRPYNQIKSGTKTIEIRLNDEKRQQIRVGDEIEFALVSDPNQKTVTVVKDVYRFNSFIELFEAFDPHEYGSQSKDEYTQMYQYYSKQDEEKYGVLGIRIERGTIIVN